MRRTVVTALGILAFTFAGIITALVVMVFYIFPEGGHECAKQKQTISENSKGDAIDLIQELCGGFVYSDVVTLVLRSGGTGKGISFFSYEYGTSDPSITWRDENTINIEISDVGSVIKKSNHVGDMRINYSIGKVMNN